MGEWIDEKMYKDTDVSMDEFVYAWMYWVDDDYFHFQFHLMDG